MSIFDNASYTVGLQGPPGAATVEQIGDLDARVAGIEELTIPTVIGDLSDVDTTTDAPASGDLLRFDGTDWAPYTPAPTVVSIAIPFAMGTGSDPIPTMLAVPWQGIYIPDACTITGYVMDADNTISVRVERAPAASPQTYATISGSETPTISSSPYRTSDTNLTTWTTALSAGDRIRVMTTGTPMAWSATLNLLLTREL